VRETVRTCLTALVIVAGSFPYALSAAAPEAGNLGSSVPGESMIAAGVWSSPDGTTLTYESVFFEPYQAVTAADMLRWVPGGAALLPDNNRGGQQDKRGFGSGGDQILINGKRLSGKSNDISSAIQRIQANVVSRIEVIRGTSAGLDVRSEGTLINIVLAEDISGGSGSWQLHSGFYGDSAEYDGLVSYSNSAGSLNYLVSAEYGPYNRGQDEDRVEEFFTPDTNELFEHRDIARPELREKLVLNASGGSELPNGDILNLNARIEDGKQEQIETTRVAMVGDPDIELLENISLEDSLEWEVGGDIENQFGANGILKTRAIYTSKTEDESELVSLSSSVPGNVPSESLVLSDALGTETIIRSSYRWPLTTSQNLELGIEGAINTLEKDVLLFEVLPDGTLDPIDVFNSDSDVEENRYEFFSTHFLQVKDNIALESALNVEYSKIEQIGADIDNSRSFTYVKPRFDLRWDIDGANQVRGSLERTVSQLDFGDFVANFDNDNDQVNAGNPDLEPEKAWEWKMSYERRLENDGGVLEAQLFYNQIEDHIDRIAATENVSAPGNIGDATHYGAFLKGSVRLAPISLEGAVIDAEYRYQESETTDPFTGAKRDMIRKPRHRYSIKFRHDITELKLNYTIDFVWFSERVQTDINYHDRSESLTPRLSGTAQYRLTDSLLLWFDMRYIIDEKQRRVRKRYDGNIADDILLRTEVRDQWKRSSFIVGLRGQF
jgi:outer membrane receptor for ferrienterochelin and colicins